MEGESSRIDHLETEVGKLAGAVIRLETQNQTLQAQKSGAERGARRWRRLAVLLMLVVPGIGAPVAVTAQAEPTPEERLAAVEAKLQYVSVEGTEMYVTGANLHIRNGLGATNGDPGAPGTYGIVNGLGNLIVGYDELRGDGTDDRTGSHNLIVGGFNNRTSHGGLVAGGGNSITGVSSVALGMCNTASGNWASVTGGCFGTATGFTSAVSGGYANSATGANSSVSGGAYNLASGGTTAVSGGQNNRAQGTVAAVSGGRSNHADGEASSVSGGYVNYAANFTASVSGGNNNVASGGSSSISGGGSRTVTGAYNWRGGSYSSAN